MTNAEYLTLEHEAQAQGYAVVCGADEAGAGPLAGPGRSMPLLLVCRMILTFRG